MVQNKPSPLPMIPSVESLLDTIDEFVNPQLLTPSIYKTTKASATYLVRITPAAINILTFLATSGFFMCSCNAAGLSLA